MNRYQFEDLISEYIENELSFSKRKEFESYLDGNPDALEMVNAIRSNIKKAGALPKVKTSSDFNDRLLDRIRSKSNERTDGSPIKGLIFGFSPIHASIMMGLVIAFVFINIQLFSPAFDSQDTNLLYTTNEKLTDPDLRSLSKTNNAQNANLANLTGDSTYADSVYQSKKDYSKKIQFVND
tara:strand:- start:361 stop:903 length:543 start_codon:yes stop_codon:yes gene_type:complete